MSAQDIAELSVEDQAYFHIYNTAIEERRLFNDPQDYDTFLSFLNEYLTTPPNPEETKKNFSVNGRVFRGVPHQPKNYFNEVELIAYSLLPNHFHLVVNPIRKNSLEKLIRSLCTRYAIYYNKKHSRKGSLFQGPYKSVEIQDTAKLALLTRYIHKEVLTNSNLGRSSYEDYLGERVTSWIKPALVLSYIKASVGGEVTSYKSFVQEFIPTPDDENMLKGIIIETIQPPTPKPLLEPSEVNIEPETETNHEAKVVPPSKPNAFAFIATSTLVFLLLLGLGLRNINISVAQSPDVTATQSEPTPQVAGAETSEEAIITTAPIPTVQEEAPNIPQMIMIDTQNSSVSANLRQEPSTASAILSTAQNGDSFELVSEMPEWYEIKFSADTNAFVSAVYAKLVQEGEDN